MNRSTNCEHDWEVVKSENYISIVKRIEAELGISHLVPRNTWPPCAVKVCLLCGKVIDEISELELDLLSIPKRKNLAKQLYKKYLER